MRPTPQSYYYSGQGRLLIGDRDPITGKGYNFVHVGNCTALSVDIAVTKFEHKENYSGQRAIDLTIVQEKKATTQITCESLSVANLALGLYGDTSAVTGATVTDEEHKYMDGGAIALDFPNVSAVTVKTGADAATATPVDEEEYEYDADFGTVYPKAGSTAFTGDNVYVSYTYGAHTRLDVFTESTPKEKYLRFEGLNTVNEDLVLIDMPRVTFDPITGLQLINEELASAEFTGNILLDPKITSGSQFMVERIITPAAP